MRIDEPPEHQTRLAQRHVTLPPAPSDPIATSKVGLLMASLLLTAAFTASIGLGGPSLHAKSPKKRHAAEAHVAPVYQSVVPRAPMRGVTVGPIESTLHPGVGYGSDACAEAMSTVRRLGGNWVSLTPFGRVWDLSPSGIDLSFEAPFPENQAAIERAIDQAHAQGLEVMLVPHLWVEKGGWRGEIEFESDAEWETWAASYRDFILTWARVAEQKNVALFSLGVELRSWVTTTRAPSFTDLIQEVRRVYRGKLTYAANWDDAQHTVIWGDVDFIGINAFFPLATKEGAKLPQMLAGGELVARQVSTLAAHWRKPVLFTEIGYTNRPDPALEPWEWPEDLGDVTVAPHEQADAYRALLASFLDEEWFAGFFVWRMYANPFDTSQEPAWGFSPLYRPAELVLRDAFSTAWGDSAGRFPHAWLNPRSTRIASY